MCPSFTPLLERALPCGVRHVAWCPTMDLLALVLEDNRLHVHRLDWQRLWVVTPESQVSALAWSQDGRDLVLGGEDGWVSILATEDAALRARARLFSPGPVAALQWVTADLPASALPDRAARFFPAGRRVPALGLAGMGPHPAAPWPPEPPAASLLLCAAGSGDVCLCTPGLLPLVRLAGGVGGTPLAAALAPDLSRLAVLGGGPGHVTLAVHDTAALASHLPAIHRFGIMAAQLQQLTKECMDVLATARKEWQRATAEWDSLACGLRNTLDKFGDPTSAAATLAAALRDGTVSDGLHQFLTVDLGETGLKKVARGMDTAVLAVHAAMLDDLAPGLERLAFTLGELRGAAQLPGWATLGLSVPALTAIEEGTLRLLLHLDAGRRGVGERGVALRTLFVWLLSLMRRLQQTSTDVMIGYPSSHLAGVASFLTHGGFNHDPVADLILPTEDEAEVWTAEGQADWVDFLLASLDPPGAAGAAGDVTQSSPPPPPLAPLLAGLSRALDAVLAAPPATLSPLMHVVAEHRLDSGAKAAAALGHTSHPQHGGWAVATANGELQVHSVPRRERDVGGGVAAEEHLIFHAGVATVPGAGTVVDCAFFGEAHVAAISHGAPATLSLSPIGHGRGRVGEEEDQKARVRQLSVTDCLHRLAVSGSRKLACVVTTDKARGERVFLFDMAEDEEEEEEDMEGGDDAADMDEPAS